MSRSERLALLAAIVLLAFALRAYWLEQQDLWGDEGVSYKATKVSLPDLIGLPWWISPPFYYGLLNLWTRIAGKSLFALRFPSVAFGLLMAAMLYRLAHSLFDEGTGSIAAFICAVSPIQVYYSQETRMYTLVTLEAALLLWFLTLLSREEKGRCSFLLWLGYLLTALVAAYTHYTIFLLIAAQVLWVLLVWRRWLLRFVLGGVGLLLSYVPWIWVLWQREILQRQVHRRFSEWSLRSLPGILKSGFGTFGVGLTVKEPLASWLAAVFCPAIWAGLVFALRRAKEEGWLLLLCLFAPLFFAWAANPFWAFFHPRYLLMAFPAFCVLLACGLRAISRRWAFSVALACMVAVSAYSLSNYFFDDAYAKGKYGTMMRYIRAHMRHGDFLLLENRQQWPLFDYYQPKGIPYAYFPQEKAADDDQVHQEMAALTEGYDRIWLVMFGDPMVYDAQHRVERWLAKHGYRAFHQGFLDADLSLFVMGAGEQMCPLRFELGDKIELIGYSLSSTRVKAGDTLLLSLYWKATEKVERPYTVFTHLLDRENHVRAQMDGQPVGGTHPTNEWEVGEVVRDNYGLEIPSEPPGEYILEVGMYYLPTMERLPVKDASGRPIKGDQIVLGTIRVDGGN